MAYRRRGFRRSFRKRGRFRMIRNTANNASPNAALNNIDLLANFRATAGITINLPEFTIWRVRIKISIIIGGESTLNSNDGVLMTLFVDGQGQTPLNQTTNSFDEQHMHYDFMYATETMKYSTDSQSPTNVCLFKEYDVTIHRKLRSLNDTLWLQLATTGNSTITNYSYSAVITAKIA